MHFSFGTKQGWGTRGSRLDQIGGPFEGQQTNNGVVKVGGTVQMFTCNPAKSPLAVVSSHSHLHERSSSKKCQDVEKFVQYADSDSRSTCFQYRHVSKL